MSINLPDPFSKMKWDRFVLLRQIRLLASYLTCWAARMLRACHLSALRQYGELTA